ncbi:hypothetical protein [Sinisalibacter lacisalsi]|uniref:hypothetical protein n=1 Tax=Sinisalibacter lacisalsi TaxID=1526570 RepID=UPI00166F125C|nr:hypothetical protein [Sinisalibacter lacisalsi]
MFSLSHLALMVGPRRKKRDGKPGIHVMIIDQPAKESAKAGDDKNLRKVGLPFQPAASEYNS